MAKKFSDLYSRMPAEAREKVEQKTLAMTIEIEDAKNKKSECTSSDMIHLTHLNLLNIQLTARY